MQNRHKQPSKKSPQPASNSERKSNLGNYPLLCQAARSSRGGLRRQSGLQDRKSHLAAHHNKFDYECVHPMVHKPARATRKEIEIVMKMYSCGGVEEHAARGFTEESAAGPSSPMSKQSSPMKKNKSTRDYHTPKSMQKEMASRNEDSGFQSINLFKKLPDNREVHLSATCPKQEQAAPSFLDISGPSTAQPKFETASLKKQKSPLQQESTVESLKFNANDFNLSSEPRLKREIYIRQQPDLQQFSSVENRKPSVIVEMTNETTQQNVTQSIEVKKSQNAQQFCQNKSADKQRQIHPSNQIRAVAGEHVSDSLDENTINMTTTSIITSKSHQQSPKSHRHTRTQSYQTQTKSGREGDRSYASQVAEDQQMREERKESLKDSEYREPSSRDTVGSFSACSQTKQIKVINHKKCLSGSEGLREMPPQPLEHLMTAKTDKTAKRLENNFLEPNMNESANFLLPDIHQSQKILQNQILNSSEFEQDEFQKYWEESQAKINCLKVENNQLLIQVQKLTHELVENEKLLLKVENLTQELEDSKDNKEYVKQLEAKIIELRSQKNKVKNEKIMLEGEVKHLKCHITHIESQNQQMSDKNQVLTEEIENLKDRSFKSSKDNVTYQSDIASKQFIIQSLQDQIQILKDAAEYKKNNGFDQKMLQLMQDKEHLNQENSDLKCEINRLQNRYDGFEKATQTIRVDEEIEELKKQLSEKNDQIDQLSKSIDEKESQMSKQKEDYDKSHCKSQELKKLVEEKQKSIEKLETQLMDYTSQVQDMKTFTQLSNLKKMNQNLEYEQIQSRFKTQCDRLQQKDQELVENRHQINSLKIQIDEQYKLLDQKDQEYLDLKTQTDKEIGVQQNKLELKDREMQEQQQKLTELEDLRQELETELSQNRAYMKQQQERLSLVQTKSNDIWEVNQVKNELNQVQKINEQLDQRVVDQENELKISKEINNGLDQRISDLEGELTHLKITTQQKQKIFVELEKQKSDNHTLKELLMEEQDKFKELTDKASQILIRINDDYVSAMDLINTYQGTKDEQRPSEACRQYQKNLQKTKNIKVTVRQSKSPNKTDIASNISQKSMSPFSKNLSSFRRHNQRDSVMETPVKKSK